MPSTRVGGVLAIVLPVLAGSSILAVSVHSMYTGLSSAKNGAASSAKAIDPVQTALLIRRLGISAETLAAAGLTTAEVEQVIASAMTCSMTPGRMERISSMTSALHQAIARESRRSEDSSCCGGANVASPSGPAATGADARPANADRSTTILSGLNSELDAAFAMVVSTLPLEKAAALTQSRAAKGWELPAEYTTVRRTASEYLAIRGALSNKRYAEANQIPLEPRAAAVLARVDADGAVVVARASLTANSETHRQLLESRLASPSAPSNR